MNTAQNFFKRALFRVIPVLFLAISILPEVSAQYFGRNKVQYDNFDFRFIQTENFDIYYYSEKEDVIMDIGRMTERWYHRLSQVFQHEFDERKPIIFYANDADFQQTNVISGSISQGVGGVTEGLKNRVVMPISETYAGTDHVLGHEMVHVFQFDIAQRDNQRFRMQSIPLWFIEGMAEYLTLGRDFPLTAMWIRDAIIRDDFPTIKNLTREPHKYFPYRFGHAFWAYVGATWGDDVIHRLYRKAGRSGLDDAFVSVLELTTEEFSEKWKQAMSDAYEPFIEKRKEPREAGALILALEIDAGNVNIGPAVSPDGEFVSFLSERELFTIEMFLANARTGEVQKKLYSAERDSHFDALRFINSAGTWSPDGKTIAYVTERPEDTDFGTLSYGNVAIGLYNLETETIERPELF